jgi:hypothetical protein
MEIRFYIDPETDQAHIYDHGVSETEVRQVMMKMKQESPPGWNEERIQKVIAYYENQTEDEQVAEQEAALAEQRHTLMLVPIELVPEVRKLIAKKRRA